MKCDSILYRRTKQKANGIAQKGKGMSFEIVRVKSYGKSLPEKNVIFFLSALDFSHECAILLYELNNLKPPLWRD